MRLPGLKRRGAPRLRTHRPRAGSRRVAAAVVLGGLGLVGGALERTAWADLPPPEGYVERCTVEIQEGTLKQACKECNGAFHGDPDHCERELAQTGYVKACQTRGASAWSEVWCDPSQPKPDAVVPPEAVSSSSPPKVEGHKRGCAIGSPTAAVELGAGLAALLAGLALARGRRRRDP